MEVFTRNDQRKVKRLETICVCVLEVFGVKDIFWDWGGYGVRDKLNLK